MSKNIRPTVPDFDLRMKEIRPVILNAASRHIKRIEELFSYVPIVDLAAIELSKVASVCPETETCVFVTVDENLFFEIFFHPDKTIIQVDQRIMLQGLEAFFYEVLNKSGAILCLKPEEELSGTSSSPPLTNLPTKLSGEVESCGQLYKSSLEVADNSRPFYQESLYNKTIKVVWDHYSHFEQIERYLSYIFGYEDKPIAAKVSLIAFRNDGTITCVLDKCADASDGDSIRTILDEFFNDDDTPIEDLDGHLWRIVVTEASGNYYNQVGLCKNGLNRYLLNELEQDERNFILESI